MEKGETRSRQASWKVIAIDRIGNDEDVCQGILGARGEKKDIDTWATEDENQKDW